MFTKLSEYIQNYANYKTRSVLLNMSDRQLADVGISRNLLNQGIHQWPWREETQQQQPVDQPAKMTTRQINKAIRQMSSMTDYELADLGVDRGSIRRAVTEGVDGRAA